MFSKGMIDDHTLSLSTRERKIASSTPYFFAPYLRAVKC